MRKFLLFSVLCGLMTTSANAGLRCFLLGPGGCLAEAMDNGLIEFRSTDSALFGVLFPGVTPLGSLFGYKVSIAELNKGASCVDQNGNKQNPGSTMQESCSPGANIAQGAMCTWTCRSNGWEMTLNKNSCESGYAPTEDHKQCVLAVNTNCKTDGGTYVETGFVSGLTCTKDKTYGNVTIASPLESMTGVENVPCTLTCRPDGWHMTLNDSMCMGELIAAPGGKKCIESTATALCTRSGGIFSAIGECQCDPKKGFKVMAIENIKECVCATPGHRYIEMYDKCADPTTGMSSAEIKTERNKQIARDRAARTATDNKNTCVGSGGEWSNNKCKCDDTKSMKVSGVECTCIAGYKWKGADKKMGCEMEDETRLQTACNAAPQGTAKWNVASKRCDCVNSNQTFDGTECKDNEDYAECKPLVASGVATWDAKREQKCMCNRQGYIIENGKCVESQDAKDKRLAKEAEDKLKASRRKINDAHASLKSMVDSFKVSVWKDEEGKFNTARLASDAIAGVVLGTVGGVVTSSVVKKNQVENGFEDLKCTIGGQVVAEWGDEFRVGIQ